MKKKVGVLSISIIILFFLVLYNFKNREEDVMIYDALPPAYIKGEITDIDSDKCAVFLNIMNTENIDLNSKKLVLSFKNTQYSNLGDKINKTDVHNYLKSLQKKDILKITIKMDEQIIDNTLNIYLLKNIEIQN
ncbi:MAG: hypothetical protein H9W80_05175 [Enterococcus sp.]|nr:hypothetical protein [Enterococcus sp.]